MTWATPKEYAWLYRESLTVEYRAELLAWLKRENPKLYMLTLKELKLSEADLGNELKRSGAAWRPLGR